MEKEKRGRSANIWNVSLTTMEQNGGFLIGKDADVLSFEEHKLKKGMIGWIREEFRKAGWAMLCGPADETRKEASACVGVIHIDKVRVVGGEHQNGKTAESMGCRQSREVSDRPGVGEEPQTIRTLRKVRRDQGGKGDDRSHLGSNRGRGQWGTDASDDNPRRPQRGTEQAEDHTEDDG